MIKSAVVGVGYWGPNLLRNLAENPDVSVTKICDLDAQLLKKIARRYPAVETTQRYDDLLKDPTIDLIAIATPVHTHIDLGLAALEADKHILITKPMASNEAQCLRLIEAAERRKKTILVDHTFVYHPAVKFMKKLIEEKRLGDLLYFQSTRMNLGLYQPDVSVIFDLMAHDFSILNELVSEDPIEITASSKHAARLPQPDIAYVQLNYASHFIASIQASWLSPMKIRQTLLTGSKMMVVYDDIDVVEKVKIFDKGVDSLNSGDRETSYTKYLQYRQGDIYSPAVPATEALKLEIEHLVDCLQHGKTPITDGYQGLRVVRLLEAADKLARSKQSWIKLEEKPVVKSPAGPDKAVDINT